MKKTPSYATLGRCLKRSTSSPFPRVDYYDTGNAIRATLAEAGGCWVKKHALRLRWRNRVAPEYFLRCAKRRGESVEVFVGWAFSRIMRDLYRRGDIRRRYPKGEVPGKPRSNYEVKLTAKGYRILHERLTG